MRISVPDLPKPETTNRKQRATSRWNRKLLPLTTFILALALWPVLAHSVNINVAWDPNTESDLAGYRLYYGTISGDYPHSIDVGNTTQHTITNLEAEATYYIAATAYDAASNESVFSEELVISTGVDFHVITSLNNVHGSIIPAGQTAVADNSSLTFTIPADDGYRIHDIVVDGLSVGETDFFTFNNVKQSHAISASFVPADRIPTAAASEQITDEQDEAPADQDIAAEVSEAFQETEDDAGGIEAAIEGDDAGNQEKTASLKKAEPVVDPEPPQLLAPNDYEITSLTPLLETGRLTNPDIDEVHRRTQWMITRDVDELCVLDVTTDAALTALQVPKLIFEQDTLYIWQVRFIDSSGDAGSWSETRHIITGLLQQDSDGNGILDHQEVAATVDLNENDDMDWAQNHIKSVVTEDGNFLVGVCVLDSEAGGSVLSIQSEIPDESIPFPPAEDGPDFLAFGLIYYKLLVQEPGNELEVSVHLSRPAYEDDQWYGYDPINDEWRNYSRLTEFSADRQKVYLTMKDGGVGDSDGSLNGIIAGAIALGNAADPNSGSDTLEENAAPGPGSGGGCFISVMTEKESD